MSTQAIPFTKDEHLDKFLTTLSETGSVSEACRRNSLCRGTMYKRRDECQIFAAAWDAAKLLAVDALEDEAHRRGAIGIEKPMFYQGVPVTVLDDLGCRVQVVEKVYSDNLLTLLLRANSPKYKDKRDLNVTGDLSLAHRIEAARDRSTE